MSVKRTRHNVPATFDSWFEYDFKKLCIVAEKHADKIEYVQRRTYNPDFTIRTDEPNGFITIFIETKGRFRDSHEARKYIDVRDSLGSNEELVFVFVNPNKAMPNARRRKDGTRHSHGEWADKHGFTHYTLDNLPEEWQ